MIWSAAVMSVLRGKWFAVNLGDAVKPNWYRRALVVGWCAAIGEVAP